MQYFFSFFPFIEIKMKRWVQKEERKTIQYFFDQLRLPDHEFYRKSGMECMYKAKSCWTYRHLNRLTLQTTKSNPIIQSYNIQQPDPGVTIHSILLSYDIDLFILSSPYNRYVSMDRSAFRFDDGVSFYHCCIWFYP